MILLHCIYQSYLINQIKDQRYNDAVHLLSSQVQGHTKVNYLEKNSVSIKNFLLILTIWNTARNINKTNTCTHLKFPQSNNHTIIKLSKSTINI